MEERIEKILSELEMLKDKTSGFWNVPRTTAIFLQMMVMVTRATKVLEIGTSNGYSGIYLAEALSHTGGHLYTVESHKQRFEMARENFKRSGLQDHIQQIFGHAPEILHALSGPFDLIFLDATKNEYQSYLENVWPLLQEGGVCIADNCTSHADELADFFSAIRSRNDMEHILLPWDNGLMVLVKKPLERGNSE